MLLSSAQGRSFITQLVHIYKGGERTLASHVANKHYFGGLFALEINWEKWKSRAGSDRITL